MIDIRCDMAARVWHIRVSEGQDVTEGDTIVILESMKMEIPVHAPATGTIVDLCVSEDSPIQQGQLIARLEPSESN